MAIEQPQNLAIWGARHVAFDGHLVIVLKPSANRLFSTHQSSARTTDPEHSPNSSDVSLRLMSSFVGPRLSSRPHDVDPHLVIDVQCGSS
jgi:hypothetical protein